MLAVNRVLAPIDVPSWRGLMQELVDTVSSASLPTASTGSDDRSIGYGSARDGMESKVGLSEVAELVRVLLSYIMLLS